LANILDYIQWRGDVPFSCSPFNDIDGLILAELGYVPLDDIVPSDFSMAITVENAFKAYSPERVPEKSRIVTFAQDNQLFEAMARSERFKDILLTGYVNIVEAEEEIQFSAMTCTVGDGTRFVSFRGTDSSFVGWKEDFTLSYAAHTTGQIYAVNYMNDNFTKDSPDLRVGGHSKGGNLALYAAAFCKEELHDVIKNVYSFDAPGFREEITASDEYTAVLPKVKSFIPESSVVGMLLSNSLEHNIVKSSVNGIMQHMAYNWELIRNEFVLTDRLSRSGTVINKALSGWLADFSDEERKTFAEAVFEVLEARDADNFNDIMKEKWSSYAAMLRALRKLPPEQQSILKDAFRKIAKNALS